MINTELSDKAGTRRVLMVRFPQAKATRVAALLIVMIVGLPWLIAREWYLAVVLGSAAIFGWLVVPLVITAVRGAYLALTPTGVQAPLEVDQLALAQVQTAG